jgi:creatinine amidohydrolase
MPSSDPSTGPLRWEHLTWPEIEQLVVDRPSEVALLPVGATEQHGPHLPTGTDTIIAAALCDAVSARTGAPVLPAVAVGCSYGHGTTMPGTLSLTPERLSDVIRDTLLWLAQSGIRRTLIVNGHFGNQAALAVAGDHLRHEHPELRAGILNWWTLTPRITAETLADGEDIHANRAETALMLALAPDQVRLDQLALADDEDRTDGLVFRYTAPVLSRNGVTGRPSEATATLGAWLLNEVVDEMSAAVERGRIEEPPLTLSTLHQRAGSR